MSSIDSSDSSPISSATTSPCKQNDTPGLSGTLSGLTVTNMQTDARRSLFRPRSASLADLERVKEKIARPDSPPLVAIKNQTANDVCFINTRAVFKPGKTNAIKAVICHQVAKELDAESSVPMALEATAAQVIGKDDSVIYVTVHVNGTPWVVNPIDCHEVEVVDQKVILSDDEECEFLLAKETEYAHTLTPQTDAAEGHPLAFAEVLLTQIDGKPHIVESKSALQVTDNSHVTRGDNRYELRQSNEVYMPKATSDDECEFEDEPKTSLSDSTEGLVPGEVVLVRTRVEGFLQPMVQDVLTEIDEIPVDILYPGNVRDAFYKMINKISFIQALLLTSLFRTADGKCRYLKDSNVLFTEAMDGSLHLTLIDLDETMPEDNGHIRLGLMGYPDAHEKLEGPNRAFAKQFIEKIKARQQSLLACVSQSPLGTNEKVIKAFQHTLEEYCTAYEELKETSFSLADLIFKVFPDYKKEWDALQLLGLDREEIADSIGFSTLEEKQQEVAERVASAKANLTKARNL